MRKSSLQGKTAFIKIYTTRQNQIYHYVNLYMQNSTKDNHIYLFVKLYMPNSRLLEESHLSIC